MAHDLFSSLDSFTTSYVDALALLVRDVAGNYRPAGDDEILKAAQCLLASRVRGTDTLSPPQMLKDFLKLRLAVLEHELFAVLHLDFQHWIVEYVEMFRGTVSQTSVYPREMVKDALKCNSSAVNSFSDPQYNGTCQLCQPSRPGHPIVSGRSEGVGFTNRSGCRCRCIADMPTGRPDILGVLCGPGD